MKDSIYADGQIYLHHIGTVPVAVIQAKDETLLYQTNARGEVIWNQCIAMPARHYELQSKMSVDGCPGRRQFFKDLRATLNC
ncbi:MAG: hypothetical protein R3Y10_10120 [Ferrimonas sp.]